MAYHEGKESSEDGDVYVSDDDSITGSLSDAYFLQRTDQKVSSNSLCYSPTSPPGKQRPGQPPPPVSIGPMAAVPSLSVGAASKPPSIKTGDVFYQDTGRTWWHASEYDALYEQARTTSSSLYHQYGSSDLEAHPIHEDEPDDFFAEEQKVMGGGCSTSLLLSSDSDPHNVLPQQSLRRSNNNREKRRLRQLRRKQMEQIQREQAVKEIRGVPQESNTCHDSIFAALFVAQLVLVVFCAIRFGSGLVFFDKGWTAFTRQTDADAAVDDDSVRFLSSIPSDDDDDAVLSTFVSDNVKGGGGGGSPAQHMSQIATSFVMNYRTVMSLVGITGFYACILSLVTVGFMLIIAKSLIETALIFCIILSLAWGVVGYVIEPQHYLVPTMGFVALFLFSSYTVYVWDRIPFSAANLSTALSAMRSTADITLLGMTMLAVAFTWCLVWCMAFIGLVDTLDECEPGDMSCRHQSGHGGHVFVILLFIFSFCWTNMVINSITRATVANAVGTWWFHPDDLSTCCSRSVTTAFLRSVTTSLGSICLGSLVLGPAQVVTCLSKLCCCISSVSAYNINRPVPPSQSELQPQQRETRGCSRCCVARLLYDSIRWLQRFNRWSFTYVGMYGYTFSDGGAKAIQLFGTREWTDVVHDNLIHNVLLMASIVIGGSTGVFGVLVEEVDGYTFTSFHKPVITAFLIGFVLGFVLSNVLLMGVVDSALNTILVCFAAGPFEFHKNHPLLSQEMRNVWTQQVWE